MRCWVVAIAFACSGLGYGSTASAAGGPKTPVSKPAPPKPPASKPPVKADTPKPKPAKPSKPEAPASHAAKASKPTEPTKPTKPPGFITHLEKNTTLAARLQALLPP